MYNKNTFFFKKRAEFGLWTKLDKEKKTKTGVPVQNIKQTVWKMYSDLDGGSKTSAEKAETGSQYGVWVARNMLFSSLN